MVIAVIPARKGSKRLPGKNTRDFCGKPLIEWTIDAAIQSRIFDKICISTNDDKVKQIVTEKVVTEKYYAIENVLCFERNEYLATDGALLEDVIHDVITSLTLKSGYEYTDSTIIMLLQPTSPLRTANDILQSYKMFDIWSYPLFSRCGTKINGAIYVMTLGQLREYTPIPFAYPMDTDIDIDTQEDWDEAERLMKERLNES
jgi:CMP-N-acetylneuraminic acid synthetase